MKKYFKRAFIALLAIVCVYFSVQAADVNMSRYITLKVKKGTNIKLDLWADAAGTQVKIVSGSKEQTVKVDSAWTHSRNYVAEAGTMTIYGNVLRFNCCDNNANVTELNASHNAQLQGVFCSNNTITSIDVSKNPELLWLYCHENSLATLDVSHNTKLKGLRCYQNTLTSLDVSHNEQLTELDCSENKISSLDVSKNTLLTKLFCLKNAITTLDVSKNTQLTILDCGKNNLTSLDVSKNTGLEELYCFGNSIATLDFSRNASLKSVSCYNNKFTAKVLDDIYCSLPDRKGGEETGIINPVLNASSPDNSIVLATNGKNATARNWQIQYYEDDTDVTGFTGTHQCVGGTGIDETKDLPAFSIYPNPVKDILNITTDKPVHSIHIYNTYGTEVAHATDATSIDVSHLPAGVYMVHADGKVTRIIKE